MINRKHSFLALAGVAFLTLGLALTACGGEEKDEKTSGSSSSGTYGGSSSTSAPAATSTTAAPAATATRPATTPAAPPAAAPTTAAAAPAASAATAVSIIDFSYQPANLTARVGQPVSLNVTNNGRAPHTFTIASVTDSGTLQGGANKAVQFTPTAAGTLTYFCNIHGQATMSGQITVTQ